MIFKDLTYSEASLAFELNVLYLVSEPEPTNMKTVTLQFPTLEVLLEFKELTNVHNCKIHAVKCLLTCTLSEAQIQLTLDRYSAKIIREAA